MKFFLGTSTIFAFVTGAAISTTFVRSDDDLQNIVSIVSADESFSTLLAAIKAVNSTDLVAELSGEGPFTVFAPTNEAFELLPEEMVPCLLRPEVRFEQWLRAILGFHVSAKGAINSTQLAEMNSIMTIQGDGVPIKVEGSSIVLLPKDDDLEIVYFGNTLVYNNATVTGADIYASNGVIHVIDRVLIPSTIQIPELLNACPGGQGNLTPIEEATLPGSASFTPTTFVTALIGAVAAIVTLLGL